MPYSFAGAVGARCQWTLSISASASTSIGVFGGWFLPSALTAGRYYWSAGNVFGSRVATTTSELEMLSANATTGGLWTTTGAGITTDTWRYIAWLYALNNTGVVGNWRVWVGTFENAPQPVTVTQTTAPVGTFTGSTAANIGNNALSGSAIQADIADCSWGITQAAGTANPFGINASTTITAAEADQVYQRWILPHWDGDPLTAWANRPTSLDYNYWTADNGSQMIRHNQSGAQWVVPTLTSATPSQTGSPSRRHSLPYRPRILDMSCPCS